jgi:ABC-type nitrate/sulfonate/bicarbonate transport system permease component
MAIEASPADAAGVERRRWHLRASTVNAVLANVASLLLGLLAWQSIAALMDSIYLPTPLEVAQAFERLLTQGDLFQHSLLENIWASVSRVLAGFALGVVLGVPLGLLMGLYKPLYTGTRSVVEPFRFIPPIAWIPLAIILLDGFQRYVFLIFLGAFFPVFVATLVGVPRVEAIHQKVVRVYGASRLYNLMHIVIPSVLPDILGGMRVGLGAAWMTIVAAEMTGGEPVGLGRMMINYAELLRIPEIVVGMIIIGTLGFLFNELLLVLERRLFRWRNNVTL